jgi:hypothetical protein
MTGLPPHDASGRYLALTVSRITAGQLRPHVWVYVVSVADARVLRRLRLDDSRAVAGWLGDRVMSPDGRDALTHDLHWVHLSNGKVTRLGASPDGVKARSASFLAGGRVLVDLTLDGTHVGATLLCSRGQVCQRVPTRRQALTVQ